MRLRQRYLGASPQGNIHLYRQPPCIRVAPQVLGPCYINGLPDELLAEILDYSPIPQHYCDENENQNAWAIPLTCLRWQRAYDRVLYRRINLRPGYPKSHKILRIRKISQILHERPGLYRHVQEFAATLDNPSDATCRSVSELLERCRSIRHLDLQMSMVPQIWPVIHTAATLPFLTSLSLHGYSGGPGVQMVLKYFDLPTLKELSMSRWTWADEGCLGRQWGRTYYPSTGELDEVFSAHWGSGTVTSMYLSEPDASVAVTESLLRWPARLTSLSMTYLCHSANGGDYSTHAIERILETQRRSLKHITLGIIPSIGSGIPDLSSFPALETLQLSDHNIFDETSPQASRKLAAPHLRRLTVSFCTEDQHDTQSSAFGPDQVRWFETFAKCVAPERSPKIRILFSPGLPWGADRVVIWPWTYLDQAVQALTVMGVDMTYSQPCVSRQEWEDHRAHNDDSYEEQR